MHLDSIPCSGNHFRIFDIYILNTTCPLSTYLLSYIGSAVSTFEYNEIPNTNDPINEPQTMLRMTDNFANKKKRKKKKEYDSFNLLIKHINFHSCDSMTRFEIIDYYLCKNI